MAGSRVAARADSTVCRTKPDPGGYSSSTAKGHRHLAGQRDVGDHVPLRRSRNVPAGVQAPVSRSPPDRVCGVASAQRSRMVLTTTSAGGGATRLRPTAEGHRVCRCGRSSHGRMRGRRRSTRRDRLPCRSDVPQPRPPEAATGTAALRRRGDQRSSAASASCARPKPRLSCISRLISLVSTWRA